MKHETGKSEFSVLCATVYEICMLMKVMDHVVVFNC